MGNELVAGVIQKITKIKREKIGRKVGDVA